LKGGAGASELWPDEIFGSEFQSGGASLVQEQLLVLCRHQSAAAASRAPTLPFSHGISGQLRDLCYASGTEGPNDTISRRFGALLARLMDYLSHMDYPSVTLCPFW